MREIKAKLTDELEGHYGTHNVSLPKADHYPVQKFTDLVQIIAHLSILNKDHLMLFRGQLANHTKRGGASTFYPTIYRVDEPNKEILFKEETHRRFMVLEQSGKLLSDALKAHKIVGFEQVRDRELVRWSILQHYQVCRTPLFDLTQSLSIACSFATRGNHTKHGYVYVFGLPHSTGRITRSSEDDIILIRLLGVSPPRASKPLFQEGYLVGTEEVTYHYENKSDLDFSRRLIAKFVIPTTKTFWNGGFNEHPRAVLDPSDPIEDICTPIKDNIFNPFVTGELKEFFDLMVELERRISVMGSRGPKDKKLIKERITNLTIWGISGPRQKEILKLFEFRELMMFIRVRMSPNVVNKYIQETRTIIIILHNALH